MNDLIRPALISAHHEIVPVRKTDAGMMKADIVGPGLRNRRFSRARSRDAGGFARRSAGRMLAGAYGFAQSSNYNSRPRAVEVLVEGDAWRVVRSAKPTMI